MATATGPGGGCAASPAAADPARGRAERCCETARVMHRLDGDMKEARVFLRGALDCRGHFPTIYRAWIAMELEHAGGVAAARALFEEWRARYAAEEAQEGGGGGRQKEEEDQGAFWCHYIAFEAAHGGGAARVRAVAEAAVAARPRDPAVHAWYAKAELRLGHADRARDVLGRARLGFAAEEDAGKWEWLADEVKAYSDSMRHGRLKLRVFLPFCRSGGGRRWWSRPSQGYERLGVA
ncbi:hypothetical protein ACP70R_004080 [Stipagrostis hirtigluma subsp. patula]